MKELKAIAATLLNMIGLEKASVKYDVVANKSNTTESAEYLNIPSILPTIVSE